MRHLLTLLSLFLAFSLYGAKPLDLLLDVNDSERVDSNVNKVYAPAPFDDLHVAGSGEGRRGSGRSSGGSDGGDGGYYASKSAKKDNGYKQFDSYHKKGGDKYGYEAHSSFGKSSGGNKGGKHQASGSYRSEDGDGDSHEHYHDGDDAMNYYAHSKSGKKAKEPKGSATDGDYYYSNYESDGEGDSEHFSEDGDHYDEDDGHYSEGYEDEESNEGYYDGEESDGYQDGEGETRQRSVVHHGGPAGGATSYSVRHY